MIRMQSDADEINWEEFSWYCFRSAPKREHIAGQNLRSKLEVEAFCPRIRYRRSTARGPVWFVEALFPGYFFARIKRMDLRQAWSVQGVKGVVKFGSQPATVSDRVVEDLRSSYAQHQDQILNLDTEIRIGREAVIAEGPFMGLKCVIQYYMPASDRVAVLLDFLGRQTIMEFPTHNLHLDGGSPRIQAMRKI
ncbi:MAG: hypothetical protein N2035_03510 [Chthoniobacterales bacterium]|nr:hypothetical protein [Chthoniobacterales bacterium]